LLNLGEKAAPGSFGATDGDELDAVKRRINSFRLYEDSNRISEAERASDRPAGGQKSLLKLLLCGLEFSRFDLMIIYSKDAYKNTTA
jgi:hypothetical protein